MGQSNRSNVVPVENSFEFAGPPSFWYLKALMVRQGGPPMIAFTGPEAHNVKKYAKVFLSWRSAGTAPSMSTQSTSVVLVEH